MSFDTFSHAMLLLIFGSFVVERSLAVLYETPYYIDHFSRLKYLKPLIAIIYAMIFVIVVDLNLAAIIHQEPNQGYVWEAQSRKAIFHNILSIAITGIFIAGGSKASLKLFRDVMQIQSSREALRREKIKSAPAKPIDASISAANGNSVAREMLFNMLDNNITA